MKKKRPPPDDPGNLAGRRRLASEAAWAEACGGITIVVGPEGGKYEGWRSKPEPDDAREKFKVILAKKLKDLETRAAGKVPVKVQPKPKTEGKVSFFTFAKER